jgi:hypothetical protein
MATWTQAYRHALAHYLELEEELASEELICELMRESGRSRRQVVAELKRSMWEPDK